MQLRNPLGDNGPLDLLWSSPILCFDDPPAPAPSPPAPTPPAPAPTPPAPAPAPAPPAPSADAIQAAAEKQVAETLGISLAEAKALVDADKERQRSEQTALEQAQADKAESDRKAATAEAVAATATFDANLVTFLVACDVPGGKVADVAVLTKAALGADAVKADPDKVVAAVAQVRDRNPDMFKAAVPAPPGTPSGVPAGGVVPPPGSNGSTKGLDAGRERAKRELENRKPETDSPFGSFKPVGA